MTAWSLVLVTPLDDKIKLGLDLRGGTSFVLEVDTTTLEPNALKDAQSRALEVIRNRVDTMGVSEPIIYPEPRNNRIIVQIPGLKTEDRERAIKNIQSAAFLEFRMVHPKNEELIAALFEKGLAPDGYKMVAIDDAMPNGGSRARNYFKRDPSKDPAGTTEPEIRNRLKTFQAPPGYEFMLSKETKKGQALFEPYFVSRRRELTGESLKNAGVDYQQFGQPIVNLSFDAKGARRFSTLTSDYAPGGAKNPSPEGRRYLAIVLDGTLYSAPFIKTAIVGGNAIIEGSFTLKEAQDLAIVLRAGALPAPVKVIEERSVDPTLGPRLHRKRQTRRCLWRRGGYGVHDRLLHVERSRRQPRAGHEPDSTPARHDGHVRILQPARQYGARRQRDQPADADPCPASPVSC